MARTFSEVAFLPEIGNVGNKGRLTESFERHRRSVVYRTAVYKQVPRMEAHYFEVIENNVFGTLSAALAAIEYGAEASVMTKPSGPTSKMDVTTRMAKLGIRSLQNGRVKCRSVRFSDAFGSYGSGGPTFRYQIARGGTVRSAIRRCGTTS